MQSKTSFPSVEESVARLETYVASLPWVESLAVLYEGFPFWTYGRELDEETVMRVLDAVEKIGVGRWIEVSGSDSDSVLLAKMLDPRFTVVIQLSRSLAEVARKVIDDVLSDSVPRCSRCGADLYRLATRCPRCGREILAGTRCPYCGYRGSRKCPECGSNILPSGEVVPRMRIDKRVLIPGIAIGVLILVLLLHVNTVAALAFSTLTIFTSFAFSVKG